MRFRIASLNLAQRIDWDRVVVIRNGVRLTRRALAGGWMKDDLEASVYAAQECDLGMARDLSAILGWGTEGQPSWRVDENRNGVIWDPSKWRDLDSAAASLTVAPGDLGDRHYRSVQWVELEHRQSGEHVWVGSAHLSNGDAGPDREAQARVLVESAPPGCLVLGIDRNSRGTSAPAAILAAAGLRDLTAGADPRRTYPAGDGRTDGVQIDAVHGRGVTAEHVQLVDPGRATDHRAWVVTISTAPTV